MLRKVMLIAGLVASAPALADAVVCHVTYGGEAFTVEAQPTADPYTVRGEKIGRYFELKVAYVTAPAGLTALSIYVYSTAGGESVLIHEAKYPADVRNAPGPWGFTGFNYVYEPTKSSEIKYWCEKT
jgi:hypothetical protein